MARSQRNSLLETRTSRLKLKVGARYYLQIGEGIALGYRRTADGFGNWQARIYMPDGRYDFRAIATADDFVESNGADVLTFFQAQEKVREVHAEVIAGKTLKPITVKEVADRYMDWFRDNRKAVQETANTIKAHIGPAFGDIVVSELTTQSIKAWHAKLAASPVRRRTGLGRKPNFGEKAATPEQKRARKSTANRILTVLKAMLNKAFQDELVNDDLAWRRVKPFERADRRRDLYLDRVARRRLIEKAPKEVKPLLTALALMPMRPGDPAKLRVADLDQKQGVLNIPQGKTEARVIPLGRDALAHFKQCAKGKLPGAWLFSRADGKQWTKEAWRDLIHEAAKAAKLPSATCAYSLRHSVITDMVTGGLDLFTVAKISGTSVKMIEQHYGKLLQEHARKALDALALG